MSKYHINTEEELLKQLRINQEKLYSVEINEKSISNAELLRVLVNKFESFNYSNWINEGKIKSNLDIRHQLFIRMELATIHYYQLIVSAINDFENMWIKTKELGYDASFTTISVTFREVFIRTSFIEKIFFTIDYFIQQMNTVTSFNTTGAIHNKQQYFRQLLEHFNMENESVDVNEIIDDLNEHIKEEQYKPLFNKVSSRRIELTDFYMYLVSIRNVLHNNGYSQKNVNKLNIGGVVINIEKGKQINFSHDIVVTIVYLMLYPLKKIVEKTFEQYPNQFWEDPYTKDIKEFMDERELERQKLSK